MSHRRAHRLATFEVERPLQVVAGNNQTWVLEEVDGGAALSRVDHTGALTEVADLVGQSHVMAAYGDGLVVARVACDGDQCEETVTRVLVLDAEGSSIAEEEFAREPGSRVLRSPGRWHDMAPHGNGVVVSRSTCGGEECVETVTELLVLDGQGSTVSEHELSREPGWPADHDRGGELIGVSEGVAWLYTSDGLLAYDVQAGRTLDRGEVPDGLAAGFICLLGDGLYTVGPLDTQLPTEVWSDDSYEAVVRRLVDGTWQAVPDSQRSLTVGQLSTPECVGGALRVGRPATAGPAWSPSSGWEDREPALQFDEVGALTARGAENQLFVLERPGVVRRVFGGAQAPMSAETLQVPADIFVPPVGPSVHMLFDASATTLAGCVQQYRAEPTQPAADCWIASIDE